LDGLIVAALGAFLIACWAAATRRHRRSRAMRSSEWESDEGRTELWTSGARCPRCQAVGGLVEPSADGGGLFICMTCGARHARDHRG